MMITRYDDHDHEHGIERIDQRETVNRPGCVRVRCPVSVPKVHQLCLLSTTLRRKIRELDKKYNDECGNDNYMFLIQSQIMPFHCLCAIRLIFGGEFVSKLLRRLLDPEHSLKLPMDSTIAITITITITTIAITRAGVTRVYQGL